MHVSVEFVALCNVRGGVEIGLGECDGFRDEADVPRVDRN